jgi:hypothetical protein
MRYAYVKDGKIVEGPMGLPRAWGNTSGFNLMSDAELAQVGWFPWRLIEVPSPGVDWVATTSTIEIKTNEVVETQVYREKTQAEKDAEIQARLESNRQSRAYAYREEADPLFFKSERGEATREEWLAKVEEIRNRYPT